MAEEFVNQLKRRLKDMSTEELQAEANHQGVRPLKDREQCLNRILAHVERQSNIMRQTCEGNTANDDDEREQLEITDIENIRESTGPAVVSDNSNGKQTGSSDSVSSQLCEIMSTQMRAQQEQQMLMQEQVLQQQAMMQQILAAMCNG